MDTTPSANRSPSTHKPDKTVAPSNSSNSLKPLKPLKPFEGHTAKAFGYRRRTSSGMMPRDAFEERTTGQDSARNLTSSSHLHESPIKSFHPSYSKSS